MGNHAPGTGRVPGEGKEALVRQDREDPNPTRGNDPFGCGGLQLSGETKHSWDVLSLYFCRNGGWESRWEMPAEVVYF